MKRLSIFSNAQVVIGNPQQVQKLTFVLMKALDVDVEHGIRVHEHSGALRYHFGQPLLVITFDFAEVRANRHILGNSLELMYLVEVEYPSVADRLVQ